MEPKLDFLKTSSLVSSLSHHPNGGLLVLGLANVEDVVGGKLPGIVRYQRTCLPRRAHAGNNHAVGSCAKTRFNDIVLHRAAKACLDMAMDRPVVKVSYRMFAYDWE